MLSILLVFSATMNSTMAATYNRVGVEVGDTADYKISQSFSTDNKTRFYVTCISGNVVTADDLSFWPNGTLDSSTSWTVNISSYGNIAYPVLLAAGLKVGDHLSSDPSSPTIDTNTTLNVTGTSRLAIHAHQTGLLYYLDGYWDQATGLLIEGNFFVLVSWFNLTLISTSVWSSGGGLSISNVALIEGGVIVLLVIALVIAVRRGRKH
jgi:hypothetical protein